MTASNRARRWMSIVALALVVHMAGCGDPQQGTISRPKDGVALDPGRPGGTPEPAPKRAPAKATTQPGDEAIKNPKLKN